MSDAKRGEKRKPFTSEHKGPISESLRTDEMIDELIRMVNGGEYRPAVYGRKHWYSLFPTRLIAETWEFGLSDQLAAIEALAETGNKRALEYLENVARYENDADLPGTGFIGSEEKFFDRYFFSHARGELQTELNTSGEYGWVMRAATEDIFCPDTSTYDRLCEKQSYKLDCCVLPLLASM